jgi:hypothetical protein
MRHAKACTLSLSPATAIRLLLSGRSGSVKYRCYETAHKTDHLEIRETPFPLTGWKRNGCRSPCQVFQPLRFGYVAHHRSRTGGRRLAPVRILSYPRMGVGLPDALRAGIPSCRSDLPSNATFTRPRNTSGIFYRRMNNVEVLGVLLALADNRIVTEKPCKIWPHLKKKPNG